MDADFTNTLKASLDESIRVMGIPATLNDVPVNAVFGELDYTTTPESGGFDAHQVLTCLIPVEEYESAAAGGRADRFACNGQTYIVESYSRIPGALHVTLNLKTAQA